MQGTAAQPQRNAINPYAKQTFPRERVEGQTSVSEHRVNSGVRVRDRIESESDHE
jgi:hypothetical protein